MQSSRSAAALGAPTALTKLGQRCSSRLRLCQEIGFLGTCSKSNLNVFRSHSPRPAPAPENLTRGFEINALGLTDALSDNFSSSEAVRLSNDERKVQEKPLSGWTCPLDIYPVECVRSSAAPKCGCCSRILSASPGRARSEPRSQRLCRKNRGLPPAPLCRPVRVGRPPHLPSCLCSLQEERDTRLARRRPQCDSQAQLRFCGNKTLPCLTGRKKIRTNVLRKGGAG